ncbi:hypothetical protein CWE13_03900 [Aliidiomarina shirensis]|uniref:Type II secretion system protein GspF domain-containing protein n=1 Tax=Aliidiomarina shirensis TaxID=1048642 RepID=A0A432WYB9_9GAMM|nr:type II secretion system F family protein [Aliidiomarina shirensis]RUO38784.1 hypothetical protein CWE13_03900 [Aliidiomarina shirensis]
MHLMFNNRFSKEKQFQFLLDFGQWLTDGQSPNSALAGMELIAKERNDRVELNIIAKLRATLAQGKPIAVGMQKNFSKDLQLLVDVGQKAGCLPALITSYQHFRERRYALIQRVIKGLIYPLVLLFASLIAVAFIGAVVLPKFKHVDSETPMPVMSEWLQQFGGLLYQFGPAILISGLLATLGFILLVSRNIHKLPNWLQNCTIFSILKAYNAIYLLQGLSLFLSCRLSLERSLQIFESRSSAFLQNHISAMRKSLARGETNMTKIFSTGLFSQVALYRLEVGSATRQPKGTLFAHLAERMMRDVERLVIARQRAMAYVCFVTAVGLILMIIIGLGQLFTDLAQQWA